MSAAGFTPIQLYRTTTASAVPSAGNLADGELAINLTDEALYFKNASGVVTLLADSSGALGSVTSVNASGGTTGLTFSGGPITSSGTLTLGGTLAVANGGTGVTTSTGTGSVVLATSPTLTTPNLGTPSAVTLTNATGLPLTTGVTGTLPVANGGTGVTTSTGTGSVVLSNSPTLVTPTLGVASATSIATAKGLVGSPAYTFTANTNTGMWSPASDTVAFSTAGGERLRIDSSGNVGIGTSSPGAKLNVVDNSASDALRITQTGAGNALVVEDSANPDATPFLIDGAGNVVLGHTSSLSIAGRTSLLQTYGANIYAGVRYNSASSAGANFSFARSRSATVGSFGVVSANDTIASINFSGDDGSAFVDAASIIASVDGTPGTGDMPGRLQFLTTADGASTPTERMRIDSAGLVGIGTTAPSSNLHVNSSGNTVSRISTTFSNSTTLGLYMDQPGDSSAARIQFQKSGVSRGSIFYRHNATPANEQMEFNVAGSNVIEAGYSQTAFRTAGAERMRIDSSGQVGIGTSSPGTRLQVRDAAAPSGFSSTSVRVTRDNYGADFSGYIDQGVGHGAIISTVDNGTPTERMRITGGGNVGIGTSSPSRRLTVSATGTDARINIVDSDTVAASALALTEYSGSDGRGAYIGLNSGALQLFADTPATNGITLSTNNTERMRITSAGNVGIGTTAPANRLAVQNDTAPTFFDTTLDNTAFLICNRGAGDGNFGASLGFSRLDSVGRVNAAIAIKQTSADADQCGMSFFTHASAATGAALQESMTITHAGNVGIGTSSPNVALEVNGNIHVSGVDRSILNRSNSTLRLGTNNTEYIFIQGNGDTRFFQNTTSDPGISNTTVGAGFGANGRLALSRSGGAAFFVNRNTSDGGVASFRREGLEVGTISVTTTATAYNTSSDYRLKDIDGPIQNSGAYIDALKPVQGSWKADGSRFIGLLAHEVQEVSETQIATGEKDGEEMQAMDYSAPEIIANLIAEVQSLRARVAQLEGN